MALKIAFMLSAFVVLTLLVFSFATLSELIFGDPEPASLISAHDLVASEQGTDGFGNCACSIREAGTFSKPFIPNGALDSLTLVSVSSFELNRGGDPFPQSVHNLAL